MNPLRQIRVGTCFTAAWFLLGLGWLRDYSFGDTDIKQLIFGEMTVLLGIVWGFITIRDARKKEHDK